MSPVTQSPSEPIVARSTAVVPPPALPASRTSRAAQWIPLVTAFAFLAIALACLGDYGPTWDAVRGDYPYGERLLEYLHTGDERFLDLRSIEPAPLVREPHPDFDVGRYQWYQISPVAGLLSAVSCRLLWTDLGWVPAMAAHHVPSVLLAAGLVLAIAGFAARRWGALAGAVAGGSLALDPVFFGHACHNIKDVAVCCFYVGAVLAGYRALHDGRLRWWLAAGALAGLALAQKPNGLFLPVQLVVFLVGAFVIGGAREPRPRLTARGFLAMSACFVVVYYGVNPAFWTAPIAGPRAVFRQVFAGTSRAGAAASKVSIEAPLLALVTTPPITLVLALLGLLAKGLGARMRLFLLVGVLLPIARNLLPGMRNYDGTRHFLEFLPMLCLLAGAGAQELVDRIRDWRPAASAPERGLLTASVVALALLPCARGVESTHPNEITYFNSFVGGLGGAQELGIPGATDYWGNSYWQGLAWIDEHAEPGAALLVPIADHVARSAAPVRMRSDIRILNRGEWPNAPVYVMYVTRKAQYGYLERALERRSTPVHEIRVQGGAILEIHRVPYGPQASLLRKLWTGERRNGEAKRRVLAYVRENPELRVLLAKILAEPIPPAEKLERFRELLPSELHEAAATVVQMEGELQREALSDQGDETPLTR